MRHQGVSGYCLYGLPGERISNVVQTALFVSDVIGSIIPMLFAPVPSTELFDRYRGYFQERGWCETDGTVRDLHLLNGKLFPFLQMNQGTISDYIDLQRLMFMLNESYRSKSFSIFGQGAAAESFRQAVTEFQTKREGPTTEVGVVTTDVVPTLNTRDYAETMQRLSAPSI